MLNLVKVITCGIIYLEWPTGVGRNLESKLREKPFY